MSDQVNRFNLTEKVMIVEISKFQVNYADVNVLRVPNRWHHCQLVYMVL